MNKIWVRDLQMARHLTSNRPKRTEIYLTVTDIAKIDSGETVIINTTDGNIILTSEKYPIDTPLK
jgi:hypothetical protein